MDQNQNLNQFQATTANYNPQQSFGTSNFTPLNVDQNNGKNETHNRVYTMILIPLIVVMAVIAVVLGIYIYQIGFVNNSSVVEDVATTENIDLITPQAADQASSAVEDQQATASSEIEDQNNSSPEASINEIINELDTINPNEINPQDSQVEQDINALQ
ncbi:MAG: hypothetical protein KatS3mg091_332 [Patescibacteria group bacterium]|nr:MAG: hypothetical protein KatS3mg091_332 [Patescibacteria group bacterium]